MAAGFYAGGTFVVSLKVPSNYPFRAPPATALTRVWHPNIDVENGRIRHPLLERDWKPVLSINTLIYGLQHLFIDPNHEDPLNQDAAKVLREDPRQFASNVRRAMQGGYVGGTHFARHM